MPINHFSSIFGQILQTLIPRSMAPRFCAPNRRIRGHSQTPSFLACFLHSKETMYKSTKRRKQMAKKVEAKAVKKATKKAVKPAAKTKK